MTERLPWWMPAWLWRVSRTMWFGSIAMGIAAYFLLSLVNDVTGLIPLWVRLATLVLAAIVVRLGVAWDGGRDT